MNDFTQTFTNGLDEPSRSSSRPRHSIDSPSAYPNGARMQAERSGSVPMPVGQRPYSGAGGEMAAFGPMGMTRSPPKSKNTRSSVHCVPCKFYLQGQCQAGRMCPFSHDLESTTRPAVCKYFAKGACKFGRKCALLHVTPDGTVVNRLPPPSYPAGPPYAMGQPQSQPGVYAPTPPGLLSMQARGLEQRPNGEDMAGLDNHQYGPRSGYDQQIDMTITSASPKFGSPSQADRLGVSPPQKGLSVLDAPLPNSFDSNGISMAARNGPFAASVPSRFGIESPPSSLPLKSQLGNTALRDLHSSAFGDRGMDGMLASIGSSPPSGTDEPLTFQKRPLHSESMPASHAMVSASLGTKLPTQSFDYSDDEECDTDREEDLLPASLRDLIPEGRTRRGSKPRTDGDTPAGFLSAARRTLSGNGSTAPDSKPPTPHSSSPSRYGGVFGRTASDSTHHIGSPLRNAGFTFARTANGNGGELSPSVSSPPKQASMSMLTQELQRTKLDAARSQAQQSATGGPPPPIAPGPVRTLSNGSTGRRSLDRGLSGAGVGKIDEEQDLFDMDEIGGPAKKASSSVVANGGEAGFGAIGGHRSAK